MNPQRNAPCPCGSGRKYKHCCWLKEIRGVPFQSPVEAIKTRMERGSYASLEQYKGRLDREVHKQNLMPLDDFQGFSSHQMERLLKRPFDSPETVSFSPALGREIDAPVLLLFNLLIQACGEEGLKVTANGNLPRDFCREAHKGWRWKGYRELWGIRQVMKEADFPELDIMRHLAGWSGLIYKRNNRFQLTRKCRKMLALPDQTEIYLELMKTHILKYDWGFEDLYPDFHIIQLSILFSLFLLQKYGSEFRNSAFYTGKFLRAFPAVLREASGGYGSAERELTCCYQIRTLERFAEYFGLVEIRSEARISDHEHEMVRKLPLLDKLVTFYQ